MTALVSGDAHDASRPSPSGSAAICRARSPSAASPCRRSRPETSGAESWCRTRTRRCSPAPCSTTSRSPERAGSRSRTPSPRPTRTRSSRALSDGLDTELPERGRSLSGGQRQRLALARSLNADPEVLVLDEPTSAVDAHTEARIAERLGTMREGRTTIVLTTSPLLLDHVDDVALLVDGRVVAQGAHRDLLRHDPTTAGSCSAPRTADMRPPEDVDASSASERRHAPGLLTEDAYARTLCPDALAPQGFRHCRGAQRRRRDRGAGRPAQSSAHRRGTAVRHDPVEDQRPRPDLRSAPSSCRRCSRAGRGCGARSSASGSWPTCARTS